ncbi:MAG TPA: polyprenyl synthetase family protein [Planctomycetota bacterium]|nr:polyprenyl synthetase family protein [Planctomycetota bacterium]
MATVDVKDVLSSDATRATQTASALDALHAAAAKGVSLPDTALTSDLVSRMKAKHAAQPVLVDTNGAQSETNLVQEIVRHPEQGTVEARAPLPYRHDEWRPAGENFKSIPETKEQREIIRKKAVEVAARLPRNRPPNKQTLFAAAEELLKPLGYDQTYIGFAMVLLNNEYWREEFAALPFEKRLFLMPHCLKQAENCTAKMDDVQLHCNNCGLCSIADLNQIGSRMGYNVLVAEGTPIVLKLIASGQVDGILGIACLNVLEKAFDKVLQVGIPSLAIPLLRDTCHNTEVDEDWVLTAIGYQKTGVKRTRSFVPLLRDVGHWFDPKPLVEIVPPERENLPRNDKVAEMERISLAWMRKGGKRFRPFVTAAAWQALTDNDDVPLPVKRVSAAMEIFHKASLIHDDIEDDDDFRYGTETLHKSHSVPVAINIGDYLLGRGYRIVADEIPAIGAEKAAKILQKLAYAHVKLSEGQGAELLWRKGREKNLPAIECLRIYALKTAPAFDVSLYAGIVLGEGDLKWERELSEFAKHLGVAYQIQNDLKDIEGDTQNKVTTCGDIMKGRPTVLFAMALEAATDDERADLIKAAVEAEKTTVKLDRLRDIYARHEIPLQAALLADHQRQRAMKAVEAISHDGMHALFTFLAATLLD